MLSRARAERWIARGNAALDAGALDEALSAFERAAAADPDRGTAWFNIALMHKLAKRWEAAVAAGRRAADLQPDDYPTWWNLGIAATATGQWALARTAWGRCGLDVPEGEGPPDMGLGAVPVRLHPDGEPEVVWVDRLDPARGRIVNIPFPSSQHRWGDEVLHDGVPVGERLLNGRPVPVFDALERLQPSTVPTLEAHVHAATPDDSTALEALFDEAGAAAEDWSRSVATLCAGCSAGRVEAHHGDDDVWRPERHFGLAAHEDRARVLLQRWRTEAPGVRGFSSIRAVT